MSNRTYCHVTRRQADSIYRHIKRGDISASKQWTRKLYGSIGVRDDAHWYYTVCDIIEFFLIGRYDLAQALIDEKTVERHPHRIYEVRTATADDVFLEPGDIIEECVDVVYTYTIR